jgi:RNA polymerase sigma-B factor
MRMHASFRTTRPDTAYVDIAGQLDDHAAPVVGMVASASRTAPRVILDLTAVTALDEHGVAVLREARAAVEGARRSLVIVNPSDGTLDALRAHGPDLLDCVRAALHAVPDAPAGAAPEAAPVSEAELVESHRGLADRLAQRFAGRGQPLDDLKQVAYVGLVMAARRYDPQREIRFSTYAQATVVGELKRYFRDHAWGLHVPRPVQEMYLAVRTATEELTQTIGRAPTPAELAARVGATEEQVIESLEARTALRVASLDAPRDADDEDGGSWYEQAAVEDGFRVVDERSWLVPALQGLPERERLIIKLRFFDGLPQSAIAAQVGISQMHVSRLLARSLRALREAATE